MTEPVKPAVFGDPAAFGLDVPDYRMLDIAITLLNILGWLETVVGWIFIPCALLLGFLGNRSDVLIVFGLTLSLIAGGFGCWVMAQVLGCLRDMARNSFYIRRGMTALAGLIKSDPPADS